MKTELIKNLFSTRTAKAFDTWAGDYERKAREMLRLRGYSYETLAGEILNNLTPRRSSLILELGTGTGVLGSKVNSERGMRLFGMDISSAMLGEASKSGAYDGLTRANATHLPFADGVADGLFSGFVLHSVWNQRRALREISRVLKPKALVVIIDLFPIGRSLWQSVIMGMAHSIKYEHGALARYVPVNHFVKLASEEGFSVKLVQRMGIEKTYSHFLIAMERVHHDE